MTVTQLIAGLSPEAITPFIDSSIEIPKSITETINRMGEMPEMKNEFDEHVSRMTESIVNNECSDSDLGSKCPAY